MIAISELLERWRISGEWATHITSWCTIDARPPEPAPLPVALHRVIQQWLIGRGIQLYTHQAQAVEHALGGGNVVIVTPTASGKTLCYNLPVLDRILRAPQTRALYLFPTKALAHDQLQALQAMMTEIGLGSTAAAYDGDTPQGHRARIRRNAQIIITNPDMLHAGILPSHTHWRELLSHLAYVVVDEMHVYRGIFGSHVANVLRRLRRLCRFYGSSPQFICSSATIANPGDLAQRLTGEDAMVVSQSGAPTGRKDILFYNPPVIDAQMGLRRPAMEEARRHTNWFLDRDLQTVVFCPSRRMVEQLVIYLRQDAARAGRDPQTIRGYRGGYLPVERRAIEEGLRQGAVRAVVATNALELGVDIGGLTVCVLVGYPGSVSSTWQRIGRAGRGREPGAALLVASSQPLDQYIVSHPEYFYGQPPERALINPDNVHVLLGHLQCALYELPFDEGETLGNAQPEMLASLSEHSLARETRGRWFWSGIGYPAGGVSLRTAAADQVSIVALQPDGTLRGIGQLDRDSAPSWVHEGAIYMHEGQQYLVEKLDWEAGVAQARLVEVDYLTEASQSLRIDIERTRHEEHYPNLSLFLGDVRLTTRVTGYRRLRLETHQHLGWGEVDLPERHMVTTACWLVAPDAVVERLREEGWWDGAVVESRGPNWAQQRDQARLRDGFRCVQCGAEERPGRQHEVHHIVPFRDFGWAPAENDSYRHANRLANLITLCPSCHRQAEQQVAVQSTLSGLGRVMRHLMPLFLMCDADDVGVHAEIKAPQTKRATLFVFDNVPGGVGLSDEVPTLLAQLWVRCGELVESCPCAAGCPSCIGAAIRPEPRAKDKVLRLMDALRQGYDPQVLADGLAKV
jgi:DEAD/DEAH box helicase domain-containing protein